MFPMLGAYNAFRYNLLTGLPISPTLPGLSLDDRPRFVSGLGMLLFLVPAVLRLYFYCSRRGHMVQNARGVLQTMLTILTPTSSTWPAPYPSLAYRAAVRKMRSQAILRIPLQTLYFDILRGRVELRNPRDHLPALFKDTLSSVSELSVCLDVGFYWWTKVLAWMVLCHTLAGKKTPRIPVSFRCQLFCGLQGQSFSYRQNPCKESHYMLVQQSKYTLKCRLVGSDAAVSRTKTNYPTYSLDSPSLLFLHTLHEETPAISLDCVPYRHLEAYIRSLQTSLTPGSFLMLGLTSRAANANRSFWSKATVLTCLPFLPRRFLRSRGQQRRLACRTTTPLLASVLSVLQLLTSGPNFLTVEVLRNVSREYADFLHQTVDELENDPSVRAGFVREWGMQGWVEERLCIAWEAALVDAGMLENWVIVVCKQG